MRWARAVPVKHDMAALIPALEGAEIKAEYVSVHMHQGHTETKQLKYNNETPTAMVHAGNINRNKTLPLRTEEEWRQATSEDHDIGYINRILSSP